MQEGSQARTMTSEGGPSLLGDVFLRRIGFWATVLRRKENLMKKGQTHADYPAASELTSAWQDWERARLSPSLQASWKLQRRSRLRSSSLKTPRPHRSASALGKYISFEAAKN